MKLSITDTVLIATLALIAFAATTSNAQAIADKPNVVVVFVDDLGWTDLSRYGSTFHETPNIDQLAGQGVMFTSAYASCSVCSPTRASLLTGKYPQRVGFTDFLNPGKRTGVYLCNGKYQAERWKRSHHSTSRVTK